MRRWVGEISNVVHHSVMTLGLLQPILAVKASGALSHAAAQDVRKSSSALSKWFPLCSNN